MAWFNASRCWLCRLMRCHRRQAYAAQRWLCYWLKCYRCTPESTRVVIKAAKPRTKPKA